MLLDEEVLSEIVKEVVSAYAGGTRKTRIMKSLKQEQQAMLKP
jgi:hypothetical protein